MLSTVHNAVVAVKPSLVYDDSAKTLSLFVKGGKLVSTQNVNFAKGVQVQHATFQISSQNLNQALKLDKRSYPITLMCGPIAAKKVQ